MDQMGHWLSCPHGILEAQPCRCPSPLFLLSLCVVCPDSTCSLPKVPIIRYRFLEWVSISSPRMPLCLGDPLGRGDFRFAERFNTGKMVHLPFATWLITRSITCCYA